MPREKHGHQNSLRVLFIDTLLYFTNWKPYKANIDTSQKIKQIKTTY